MRCISDLNTIINVFVQCDSSLTNCISSLVIRFRDDLRGNIQIFFRFSKLNQDTSSFEEFSLWLKLLSRRWTYSALTRGSGAKVEAEMAHAAVVVSVDPETVHRTIEALPLPCRDCPLDLGPGARPHEESVRPVDGHRNLRFSFSTTSRPSIVPALR
jgi:hypothetical protein